MGYNVKNIHIAEYKRKNAESYKDIDIFSVSYKNVVQLKQRKKLKKIKNMI